MARPQGIHRPLMVPYGPSIEVATAGDSVNGFNVAVSNGSDGNETNIIDLGASGIYLGIGITGKFPGTAFTSHNVSIDGGASVAISHGNGSLRGGYVQQDDNYGVYTPAFQQFSSQLKVNVWNSTRVTGSPDFEPTWASAWYATRLSPAIVGNNFNDTNTDFALAVDQYSIVTDVTGSGGQCEYIAVTNENTLGMEQTFLKLTIDGVVKEYDLASAIMVPAALNLKRGYIFPFPFRFNSSLKIEAKDTAVTTGVQKIQSFYSLDA